MDLERAVAGVGLREWLAVGRVIASGRLSRYGGDGDSHVDRFEAAFAQKIGVDHVLTVANGTGALICSLVAAGIGPGDEVLVPAYTWIATAAAPLAVGAVPVLVDIDETLTMDPDDIVRRITPATKAIIPVHMANMVCDMDRIMRIAEEHGLIVIEDACQAVGATYKGRRTGSIGHAGAFSFNQFKNINVGEGGAVATSDRRLFSRARIYHDVGSVFRGHLDTQNEPQFPGINLKASQIQGAMLNMQLRKLDPMIRRLRDRYSAMSRTLQRAGLRVGPHNDRDNAIGLHVIFDSPGEASAFAARNRRGVYRLYDSSRHVFSNWQPVLAQRGIHPRLDPYQWASRRVDYSDEACAPSLDLLKRTCRIGLGEQYPLALMKFSARKMVQGHERKR